MSSYCRIFMISMTFLFAVSTNVKKKTKKNKYVKNCKNILTRITNMQLENMIGKVDYKELMYF